MRRDLETSLMKDFQISTVNICNNSDTKSLYQCSYFFNVNAWAYGLNLCKLGLS